jgi:hypothetical protein
MKAKQVKEELEKIDLLCICQNQHGSNSIVLDMVSKVYRNGIERHNLFSTVCLKILLALQEKKHTWCKED